MSAATDRAQRIRETMGTPGWQDILAIHREMAGTPREQLFSLMARKPETMNLKTAARYAVRAKALDDFMDEVLSAQRILDSGSQPARAEHS